MNIREAGYDETWLQKEIEKNPSILGFDNVKLNLREKSQPTGGRIDFLLIDQDEQKMYETEIMLGSTNPDHIIRVIEYWDIEKKRYQNYDHYPVLVAEDFERRFFNVIQLFGHFIPIIAIKIMLIEVGGKKSVISTRIYSEQIDQELEPEINTVNEEYWVNNAPEVVESAREFLNLAYPNIFSNLKINYSVKSYISLLYNGEIYFKFDISRNGPIFVFYISEKDENGIKETKKIFMENNFNYKEKTWHGHHPFVLSVSKEIIQDKKTMFLKLAELSKKSYE